MDNVKLFSLEEAHLHFAKTLNGQTWSLLEKKGRTREEDELMLYAAYASCYHWLLAGTGVNHQRGEWLISRVCCVLGLADDAVMHASRCLELTTQYADLMKDFDLAFAYEGMGRACALAGKREDALHYIQRAEEAGQAIADPEDKVIFVDDFKGGNWYGLK